MPGKKIIAGLVGWLLLSFLAGGFGSLFPPGEWYAGLLKPPWTPPNWLFGPVWTLLYIMMAIAAWLLWRNGGFSAHKKALIFFTGQLVLDAFWSYLFFGLHSPGFAFAEIILLWAVILLTVVLFYRRNHTAGWLLVPYLLWVSFAAALNLAIWRLNG